MSNKGHHPHTKGFYKTKPSQYHNAAWRSKRKRGKVAEPVVVGRFRKDSDEKAS